MDKKVIFAVAGSGKTRYIINQLNLNDRSLVITYTNNNVKNLREGIVKKFGHIPPNIILSSYFSFIYSFCYCPFLSYEFGAKGINYDKNLRRYIQITQIKNYFFDNRGRIYSNRIAKLLEIKDVLDDVNSRLSKYFDNLFIDEVQDFAGNDFNFLNNISTANLNITVVGDFYQHTFDTSRDGNVRSKLHKEGYDAYKNHFINMGFDPKRLQKSYRCSPAVCNFITEKIGIEIDSHRDDNTTVHFIETSEQADEIFQDQKIVKLFFQENHKYDCYSENWGGCKGENRYDDVCIVLNKTTLKGFQKNILNELNPQTKNKLYVACSRTRGDLYFVSGEFYMKYKK